MKPSFFPKDILLLEPNSYLEYKNNILVLYMIKLQEQQNTVMNEF